MAKQHILHIDPSPTLREIVAHSLKSPECDVFGVSREEDACELLMRRPVDCILTEITLTEGNGIEIIRHARGNIKYRFIPILVVSSDHNTTKKNEAKLAGATGWIAKPFLPEKLSQTVKRLLADQNVPA